MHCPACKIFSIEYRSLFLAVNILTKKKANEKENDFHIGNFMEDKKCSENKDKFFTTYLFLSFILIKVFCKKEHCEVKNNLYRYLYLCRSL